MIRFLLFPALLAGSCWLSSCSGVSVNAGEEAVLVAKPIIFGHGGVDPTPIQTGQAYVALTTDAIIFQITPVREDEEFDDIITKDNVAVDFHAYLTRRIIPGKTPLLLDKFGEKWYYNNIQQEFRTEVRKEASNYGMMELATRTAALDTLERNIFEKLNRFIQSKGIPVEIMGVQIGKATPNEGVMKAMNETAENQQRQKTEVEKGKAEEARRYSEEKRALADNAYRNAMGLSPEQFVRLEAIKMQGKVAEVAAQKGATVIIGSLDGAGSMPIR